MAVVCAPFLVAQRADTTELKQVIIFGRHAARTPAAPNALLDTYSSLSYPVFPVPGGSAITPNGKTNEVLLGGWFRLWLTQEHLLTGDNNADAGITWLRAQNAPLITDTAQAFAEGLLPATAVTINTTSTADPLFDPIDAGVATLNQRMAISAINGRLGGNPQSLSISYAPELALLRSVLFNYPAGTSPEPAIPNGKTDVTTIPIVMTPGPPGNATVPVSPGGLGPIYFAIDPFMMEYVDGMPLSDVAWGRLDANGINQVFRLYDVLLNLEYRTPYLARVQSSNLASHIVRTLVQSATGNTMTGALGTPADKVVVLISTNTSVYGLAGLLQLDWVVPGFQPDVASLGGAIVFELRQSRRTGEYIVRARYVTQTMDQLRNRTPLTLDTPPANVPLFIPGCSAQNATFDCPLATFLHVTGKQIDLRYVDFDN